MKAEWGKLLKVRKGKCTKNQREREGTEGKILFPQTKIHWSGNNSRNYCCMQFWITL